MISFILAILTIILSPLVIICAFISFGLIALIIFIIVTIVSAGIEGLINLAKKK